MHSFSISAKKDLNDLDHDLSDMCFFSNIICFRGCTRLILCFHVENWLHVDENSLRNYWPCISTYFLPTANPLRVGQDQ